MTADHSALSEIGRKATKATASCNRKKSPFSDMSSEVGREELIEYRQCTALH